MGWRIKLTKRDITNANPAVAMGKIYVLVIAILYATSVPGN